MKRRETMNILLIFFALPIAVIIISIALQKILKCPILVAAIIFAIFLIVTFIVNNLNFLIAAIVYAIISFITAYLTCLIGRILARFGDRISCGCRRENQCGCNQNEEGCTYQISNSDGLSARINVIPNANNNNNNNGNNNNCCCRRRGS